MPGGFLHRIRAGQVSKCRPRLQERKAILRLPSVADEELNLGQVPPSFPTSSPEVLRPCAHCIRDIASRMDDIWGKIKKLREDRLAQMTLDSKHPKADNAAWRSRTMELTADLLETSAQYLGEDYILRPGEPLPAPPTFGATVPGSTFETLETLRV